MKRAPSGDRGNPLEERRGTRPESDRVHHHVGSARLRPVGRLHAVNHDGVPRCTNVGVVLDADGEPVLYHPGDTYDG